MHKSQRLFTVYPKKYAQGFCFAVLCCGYTLTDFRISIRLTSLALWQSNDCPSASKATLMNMEKYFMWIHYERLHNHNKAKRNKTVCIFLGIYCSWALLTAKRPPPFSRPHYMSTIALTTRHIYSPPILSTSNLENTPHNTRSDLFRSYKVSMSLFSTTFYANMSEWYLRTTEM